jgi:DNA-binding transcriptional regulator YiaG
MIKDVTLTKGEVITMKIRWQAGAHTIVDISKPLPAPLDRAMPEETLNRIRQLSEKFTPKQIVEKLNREGYVTGTKQKFTTQILHQVSAKYGIKSYYKHLREKGKLTAQEMAAKFGVLNSTVIRWCRAGLLSGCVVNDRGEYLFDPVQAMHPVKRQGEKLETRKGNLENYAHNLQEV